MISEGIRQVVVSELRRGDEARRAAEVLCREGLLRDAMSRAYYAALHFARAVLLVKGEEPRTHEGVLRRFSLHFVKSGLIGREEGRILGRLQKFRAEADYGVESDFAADEVEAELGNLTRFESKRVHSPRLAASLSYRRKPVSRKPDWIPCQARNDGLEQKPIPRGLPRGRSWGDSRPARAPGP